MYSLIIGLNFGTNIIVMTVEKTHFIKEIKLSEKPFKKHCTTEYARIIKKQKSKKFKKLIKLSKKSIFTLTTNLFSKRLICEQQFRQ